MTQGISKKAIGNMIRDKRSALRLSQEELADRAGLHRTYISDLERGARNPTLDSLERLAAALEISTAALFHQASKDPAPSAVPEELVRVLLVEDDAGDVDLTLRAFRDARLKNPVHVVRDGEEALDFVFGKGLYSDVPGHRPPGLILLDLHLPKIGGMEVLRRIRANESTRHIDVVVLIISNRCREIAECRRLGAENYIVKPVGFQNLSEATPPLHMQWALVKPPHEDTGGAGNGAVEDAMKIGR